MVTRKPIKVLTTLAAGGGLVALSRQRSRTRSAAREAATRTAYEAREARDRSIDTAAGRLLEYINSELDAEAAFKASLESRAFALITANLGIATLFVALATQFDRWATLGSGVPHWWVFVALYLAAGSIVLGVVSAVPIFIATAIGENERKMLSSLRNGDAVDPISERLDIIEVKNERLRTMRRGNSFRSWVILVSFVLFGAAATALLVALYAV